MKLYNVDELKYSLLFYNKKAPRFTVVFLSITVFILLLFIILSFLLTKTYVVKADGSIISDQTSYISSLTTGQVEKIIRKDGEFLKQGDIILELNNEEIKLNLTNLKSKQKCIIDELETIDVYEKSLKDQKNHLKKNQFNEEYYQKIEYFLSTLDNEKINIQSQNRMLEKRMDILNDLNNKIKEKELNNEVDTQEYKDLLNERISIEEEITSINTNISLISNQTKQVYYQMIIDSGLNKKQLNNQLVEVQNNLEIEELKINEYIVKAPKEGVLHYFVDAKEGVTLTKGQLIGNLTPHNSEFYAEVFVSSEDITKISKNDNCKIEIIGTNTKKFGTISGIIEKIDYGTINKESNGIFKAFYRVEIKLNETYLKDDDNKKIDVAPSMQVQAKIVYDEETYFEWLLNMLFKY